MGCRILFVYYSLETSVSMILLYGKKTLCFNGARMDSTTRSTLASVLVRRSRQSTGMSFCKKKKKWVRRQTFITLNYALGTHPSHCIANCMLHIFNLIFRSALYNNTVNCYDLYSVDGRRVKKEYGALVEWYKQAESEVPEEETLFNLRSNHLMQLSYSK